MLPSLLQDCKYALRILWRNRGLTFVSMIVLAIGIGANTAIFSFVNGLFLRPLPVSQPERLIRVYEGIKGESTFGTMSYPNFVDLTVGAAAIGEFAAHSHTTVSFSMGGESENLQGEVVSGNYFSVNGIHPILGRLLQQSDDQIPGAHPVAVISHSFWKRRFLESPDVLGFKIYANGHPFTIVGVLPANFHGPYLTSQSDLYATISMYEQVRPVGISHTERGWGWLEVTGKLNKGVTIAHAQAVLDGIANHLNREHPKYNQNITLRMTKANALPEAFHRTISRALTYFMILTSLVLVVVCANVAGSTFSHAIARRREFAIRTSLGASGFRLMCQWIAERVLVSMIAGIAGLLIALWCREGIKFLLPPAFKVFVPSIFIDFRLFLFAFLLSLIAGIVVALAPVWLYRKENFALREKMARNKGLGRFFGGFITVQIAVSVIILIAAALLLQSLVQYSRFDVGFNVKNLLTATIGLKRNGYEETRGREFYRQLTERISGIHGVQSVTYASLTPLSPDRESFGYEIPGYKSSTNRSTISISTAVVGPGYFKTMGIPIVVGRAFRQEEMESKTKPVLIVNETMSKRIWPGTNPIGKFVRLSGEDIAPLEVIGVAKDITYYTIGEERQPFVYLPAGVFYFSTMTMQIRTDLPPEQLKNTVLKTIESLDPAVAPYGMQTLEELRRIQLFPARALSLISNLLGILSIILSGLGIYGIVSYSIHLRRNELGIRMALGATAGRIVAYNVFQGMRFSFLGTGIGLIAAFVLSRYLTGVLFQVSPVDSSTFILVPLGLTLAAFAAAMIPSLSATRIDPAATIRCE